MGSGGEVLRQCLIGVGVGLAACRQPAPPVVVVPPVAIPAQPPPVETAPPPPMPTPEERAAKEREIEARLKEEEAEAAANDPLAPYTLAEATRALPGTGPISATIKTTLGTLTCRLFDDKAPFTVANFIGLARGTRPWKDPLTGNWGRRPAYDGTIFHRVIKGFMIQGGDPKGTGTGEPGYTFADENWSGAKHDRAGLLCMANRGHDTNGAQFFITDAAAAHLDGNYTIFGECSPASVVHAIAATPVLGERPTTPVVIERITISR